MALLHCEYANHTPPAQGLWEITSVTPLAGAKHSFLDDY